MCEVMRSLVILSLLCYWAYRATHSHRSSFSVASQSTEETLFVNGTAAVGTTDDDFVCATLDWWPPQKCDYGTCSWGSATLLNLDLENAILSNAIKAFSPLKIRLGGTLQDKVIYLTEEGSQQPSPSFLKDDSQLFRFTLGYLPMSRWDQLNIFFNKTGAVIIFGLNALRGKTIDSNGAAIGPWNSSNAESLIRYTVKKGYTIHGWELGNELCGTGVGTRVAANQYAADTNSLQSILQNVYAGFEAKPLVLSPGGFFDANWLSEFISETPQSLQVVTHHIYNLGPGSAGDLVERILDPSVLDGISQTFKSLRDLLEKSNTSAVAWVGESGGAYNSGHDLVTNAFVFSFWYLDQLGMAASYDTKTYCRQTLIGGNYGLLDTKTFVPNPDYYSALLWHRLMGNKALSTSFSGTNKIRTYAHCSKKTQGITVLLINLDSNTTVPVRVSTESAGKRNYLNFEGLRSSKPSNVVREEYHLTAKDGDLHSKVMLLNGKALSVNSSGNIPNLEPITVRLSDPIAVAPFSIVFVHIPNVTVPACT